MQIASRYITGLANLAKEHIESLEPSDTRADMDRYLQSTLEHIRYKKSQDDLPVSVRDKFAAVII